MTMYITQLEDWNSTDWVFFFAEFHLSEEEELEVKQILTLPLKSGIEWHFERLYELEVINWIWPWFLMKGTRRAISWLFRWVRYEWHDIMYAVWWIEYDRLKADYWLFKYSLLSISDFIRDWEGKISPILMLFIYIASVFQFVIALFCYIMVVIFGRFWSFRYVTMLR